MNKIETPSQPKSERIKCRRLFRDLIFFLVKIKDSLENPIDKLMNGDIKKSLEL